MGYYTYYELDIVCAPQEIDTFGVIKEVSQDHYAINERGGSTDSTKWYRHEEDMKGVSKRYKDIVFELSGEGEENDDMWKKYFKNGLMQTCKARIEFDLYDIAKLE